MAYRFPHQVYVSHYSMSTLKASIMGVKQEQGVINRCRRKTDRLAKKQQM